MFDKLRPLADRVLVKRIQEPEKTAGGIIIPDAAKEKPLLGAVVAVGKGKRDTQGNFIALDVKVGDTVYFTKYAGSEAPDKEYVILREDEILGILEK